MKKLLSLTLALVMALGLALPASAAEETADESLARITKSVKDTLDLDTEDYDDFWGERYEDGLAGVWDLYWSGLDTDLSVSALDDGTVISYRAGQPYTVSGSETFPTFPQGDAAAAARAADDFLDKVLTAGESVELGEPRGMDTLGGDSYRFSGTILLNGLPSPLSYSITVDAADNQVRSFSRDAAANVFLGDVPASAAFVSRDRAAGLLTDTLAVKLEYVREADSSTAVLRYLPEDTHAFCVDAATGELLDMTELEEQMEGLGMGGSSSDNATAGESSDSGLSPAEQAGIAQMEGVRSSDALDQSLRAEAAYGLADYALSSAAYRLVEAAENGEEDQVLCVLSYVRPEEDGSRSRTITVDARTGAVLSVSSRAPWLEEGEVPALSRAEAQTRAETFLAAFCGARWKDLVLYGDSPADAEDQRPYDTFTYVQQVNGIPFPENRYTVAIDSADGSVYRLDYNYDEDVTFASTAGIVGEAAALSAWAGTYDTVLAYRLVPRPLDGSRETEARLLELGLTHFYELRLTYALEREDWCPGIDAATGKPVVPEKQDTAITYTDLSGSGVKADVEKLARYGVGYDGGRFQPAKQLTQWDLVALLASLDGYRIDPETADESTRDAAYSAAYRMGALARGTRDEDSAVTRGQAVKCLLDCAGYGPAARLQGIYTCAYSDAADIPEADLGYAAIAQALGMAQGSYRGDQTATRGELASMLCRLLER